jgi:hypothetical protein
VTHYTRFRYSKGKLNVMISKLSILNQKYVTIIIILNVRIDVYFLLKLEKIR